MGRRIFVGDIQGCREPLQRLLDAVKFAPGSDRLLPAGDLVNKGPDSPGTLALLMQLGAEPVLGNHDLHWCRKAKDQEPARRAWLPHSAAFPPREHTAPSRRDRPAAAASPYTGSSHHRPHRGGSQQLRPPPLPHPPPSAAAPPSATGPTLAPTRRPSPAVIGLRSSPRSRTAAPA